MRSLLDLLARAGVEKAGAEKQWPVDVVTAVLRKHPEEYLPVRHDLTFGQATAMEAKLADAAKGLWSYPTLVTKDERGNYTVRACATQVRESKFAVREDGEDTEGDQA